MFILAMDNGPDGLDLFGVYSTKEKAEEYLFRVYPDIFNKTPVKWIESYGGQLIYRNIYTFCIIPCKLNESLKD